MIDLDELQRRVDAYFQCGQRNEPGGRIILDLMRALRQASADLWEESHMNDSLRREREQRPAINEAYIQDTEARLRRELELRSKRDEQLFNEFQELRAKYETLKDAYLRLMRGVEENMTYKGWKALHDDLRAKHPDLPDLTPIMQATVLGDCGKVHPTFEDWQRCEQCGAAIKARKRESVPVTAPDEWFVWAIDRLREDSKDGNFHRSYRFAQALLTAIDAKGYAIVKKEPA